MYGYTGVQVYGCTGVYNFTTVQVLSVHMYRSKSVWVYKLVYRCASIWVYIVQVQGCTSVKMYRGVQLYRGTSV